MWSVMVNISRDLEKNMYSDVVDVVFLKCQLDQVCCGWCSVQLCPYLGFGLLDMSTTVRGCENL